MNSQITITIALVISILLFGCVQDSRSDIIGKAVLIYKNNVVSEIEAKDKEIRIGNRGFIVDKNTSYGFMRNGPWRLKIEGNEMEGTIEGIHARFKTENKDENIIIEGNIGNISVKIENSTRSLNIEFFDTKIKMKKHNGKSKSKDYVLTLQNMEKIRNSPLVYMFLVAICYEIFAHDQNRRSKFRPPGENAPLDFFEKGGWGYKN